MRFTRRRGELLSESRPSAPAPPPSPSTPPKGWPQPVDATDSRLHRRICMPRGPRWRWTPAAELNALWVRWKAGDTFDAMGQAFGCSLFTSYDLIRRSGGVPPCPRRRSPRVLSTLEREEISRALAGARGPGVAARDRAAARACAVDDQSRDSTAWRSDPLSRDHGRRPSVAAGASAQAVPPGDASPLVSRRRGEAAGRLGTAADRGLAREHLSHRADDARLA
jgi:hypothetical protein